MIWGIKLGCENWGWGARTKLLYALGLQGRKFIYGRLMSSCYRHFMLLKYTEIKVTACVFWLKYSTEVLDLVTFCLYVQLKHVLALGRVRFELCFLCFWRFVFELSYPCCGSCFFFCFVLFFCFLMLHSWVVCLEKLLHFKPFIWC